MKPEPPTPQPATEKQLLRRMLRLRRREFVDAAGPVALRLHALAMAHRLLPHFEGVRCIAAYLGNGREVDALPALDLASAAGLETALPFVDRPGGSMHFLRWHPGDRLVEGPYGLRQPHPLAHAVEPDLILAPLVGFDRAGHRLGQGGSFYDRAFARHPAARRIGLAWAVQQAHELPSEAWDLPLHAVLTEQDWIDCT